MDANKELVPQSDGDLVAYESTLYIDEDTPDIDFGGFLNRIFQYISGAEILSSIKTGAQYVVQVPVEFSEGLEAGKYFLMENAKTGVQWPNLMEIGENGRKQIVTPLSVMKEEFIQGNPAKELASGYHQLYMQQQMQSLTQVMEQTLQTVQEIERGQKSDRIALIESGCNQIVMALNEPDEQRRLNAIQLARQSLFDGQSQIVAVLQDKASGFGPLPKYPPLLLMKELTNKGYLEQKDAEYQEIQDYYDFYLKATRILAESYAIVGDLENARRVFERSEDRVGQIDFASVKTIEYAHKDYRGFYRNAKSFLNVEAQLCLKAAKQYDCIEISVSAEKLLEVIGDGKSEEISESEAK